MFWFWRSFFVCLLVLHTEAEAGWGITFVELYPAKWEFRVRGDLMIGNCIVAKKFLGGEAGFKYHVYFCFGCHCSCFLQIAQKIGELEAALRKKDEDMKAMEERYKMYLEKARNVSGIFLKIHKLLNILICPVPKPLLPLITWFQSEMYESI